MTPQINHLGKMSPVLRVSTHIYGVSKDIDEKTFVHSSGKPEACDPSNRFLLVNMSPVLRVSTHIYRVSKKIDSENIQFHM